MVSGDLFLLMLGYIIWLRFKFGITFMELTKQVSENYDLKEKLNNIDELCRKPNIKD